jgi:Uma2 family endonuclease
MAMPRHRGLMTLEEYDALPEDNSAHYELQEGILVVSPRPAKKHQQALARLSGQIESQLPPEWECVIDFEVVVRGEQPVILRAPDLVVVSVDAPENRVHADEVRLAVEIISPVSRDTG